MNGLGHRVRSVWGGTGVALRVVLVLLLLGYAVVVLRALGESEYHVRLRHAAGIESGDDVRVAGLPVGEVTGVETVTDQVEVTFRLDEEPTQIGVTEDSAVEVKLLSILGERFLSLTPGSGQPLADGGTVAVEHARDTYTMERFWLESVPQVQQLDLGTIERAVDVLATDLEVAPEQLRKTLDGISGVAGIVEKREAQLQRLLEAIEGTTDLVQSQRDEIDRVLEHGSQVMAMVHERRRTLRVLLRQAQRFVTGLTELVRRNEPQLRPALRDLRDVLQTFRRHRAELEQTLELAGPTMRVFTNAAGDGPWLGVNAPYAIFPDDYYCAATPEQCS